VLKHTLGRLPLPEDSTALLPGIRAEHGIEELPLTEGAVLQLTRLPALHKDPFDRMLLCQAIHDGLLLVTPDEQLWRYPLRTAW
jgi:PIN domain nuclease of toxin-antitoxin system